MRWAMSSCTRCLFIGLGTQVTLSVRLSSSIELNQTQPFRKRELTRGDKNDEQSKRAKLPDASTGPKTPVAEDIEKWDGLPRMPSGLPALFDGSPVAATLQWYPPPFRPYSRRELLVDLFINICGELLSLIGGIALMHRSRVKGDAARKQLGLLVYSLCVIIMFGCSAARHTFAWNWNRRRLLCFLDYTGISVMIAGSYTPPMIEAGCYKALALVWTLAVTGALLDMLKLLQGESRISDLYQKAMIIRFLAMGWCCVFVLSHLRKVLPSPYFIFAFAGGMLYMAGIPIFLGTFEFHTPVWHAFVIAASICGYLTNYLYIVGIVNVVKSSK